MKINLYYLARYVLDVIKISIYFFLSIFLWSNVGSLIYFGYDPDFSKISESMLHGILIAVAVVILLVFFIIVYMVNMSKAFVIDSILAMLLDYGIIMAFYSLSGNLDLFKRCFFMLLLPKFTLDIGVGESALCFFASTVVVILLVPLIIRGFYKLSGFFKKYFYYDKNTSPVIIDKDK